MSSPAWTCPRCDTTYDPGFPWDLDVCQTCEDELADKHAEVVRED